MVNALSIKEINKLREVRILECTSCLCFCIVTLLFQDEIQLGNSLQELWKESQYKRGRLEEEKGELSMNSCISD